MKSMIKGLGVVALAVAALGAMSAKAATVALVTINQQALFFNQINDGAKQAADKAGAKLVIFNANNVAAAQNSAIEDYIAQKVDGIVLIAIDVNGVKPAVTAAKNAGIPVVAMMPVSPMATMRLSSASTTKGLASRSANTSPTTQRTKWAAPRKSALSARSIPSFRTSAWTASRRLHRPIVG